MQPHSLTGETIHRQKEHCTICRPLQGPPTRPRLLFPRNSMSQTELFAPLPVSNILGLVRVNRKELWHKAQFTQPPNRKALITCLKASFVQMTTVEHDELKKKTKPTQATWPEPIHPARCKQQADTTVSFICFLSLTSLSCETVMPCTVFIKTKRGGSQPTCTRRSATPLLFLCLQDFHCWCEIWVLQTRHLKSLFKKRCTN